MPFLNQLTTIEMQEQWSQQKNGNSFIDGFSGQQAT